jgi:hypothetical protein
MPDPGFQWESYMEAMLATFEQFGIHPEVTDKSRVNNSVKKMFLKDDSIGKMIDLSFIHHPAENLPLNLKLTLTHLKVRSMN